MLRLQACFFRRPLFVGLFPCPESIEGAMATVTPRMKRSTRVGGKQKCILDKGWRFRFTARRLPDEYIGHYPRR